MGPVKSFLVILASVFVAVVSSAVSSNDLDKTREERATDTKWWETASFYQVYPRSFRDSNGDGIGDIKGITESLEYLKEIGITAAWLSPIFTSPMIDFGYDISNFTAIDPIFGTMEDFDALIVRAKQVGVKIILDFVPNHSSDECEWFAKSVARDPEFEDFYIWHPGKIVDGVRQAPTNWVSIFRGSAWTWNEQRQQYYLHQFEVKQPDFNFRNPKVREYMNEILRFWLRKGIDGFRVDAMPFIFEMDVGEDGQYLDDPVKEDATDFDDYGSLDHVHTFDQPENIDLAFEWRRVVDEFQAENGGDDRIIMIEAYSPVDVVMQYFGNETAEGAQIPFNFYMITSLNKYSNAHDYAEAINLWMDNLPENRTSNWVMGNHDQRRIGSRMGSDRMDMFNILLMTLPGCSVTYQGEEIGMIDVWISWEETVDPQACNTDPSVYENHSRDPCRTPFQWNDEKNAGFTSGNSTWLPVSESYPLINVQRERGIPFSPLNIFKQLQILRAERTLKLGDAVIKAASDNVLAVKRSLTGEETYIILLNINDNVEDVNLHAIFGDLPADLEYALVTEKSLRRKGDKTYTDQVILLPKETVVLRSTAKSSAGRAFGYSLAYLPIILVLLFKMY